MAPGFQRLCRLGEMQVRRRGDVDDVEIALEQGFERGRRVGDGVLGGDLGDLVGVDVAEGGDLIKLGQIAIGGDMGGADTAADDADLETLAHRVASGRLPPRRWALAWAINVNSVA